MFAIATNTPVITFATRLLMFTGCYSQVNVLEMLQSADISCPANNASSSKCNARLYTELSCTCRRKWKCRCLGIPSIHNNYNNIKKFRRKIIGPLISW
jgi:hypothetical protein